MQIILPIDDPEYDLANGLHPATLNRLTRAEDEEGENHRWQEFIDRACANTQSNSKRYYRVAHDSHLEGEQRESDYAEHNSDVDGYGLQANDILWEIGCQVSMRNILLIVSNAQGL